MTPWRILLVVVVASTFEGGASVGWRPRGWRPEESEEQKSRGGGSLGAGLDDIVADSTGTSSASCDNADAHDALPAWLAGRRHHQDKDEEECGAFYRRYDAVPANASRLLVVRDGYPGIGLGQWAESRAVVVALATLANRHVVFESCQRGGDGGGGDAWLATYEAVVACDAEVGLALFHSVILRKTPSEDNL
jgi:hypothetical protein